MKIAENLNFEWEKVDYIEKSWTVKWTINFFFFVNPGPKKQINRTTWTLWTNWTTWTKKSNSCCPDFRHGRKNEKYTSSWFYYQDRDKISCQLQESLLILGFRKKKSIERTTFLDIAYLLPLKVQIFHDYLTKQSLFSSKIQNISFNPFKNTKTKRILHILSLHSHNKKLSLSSVQYLLAMSYE